MLIELLICLLFTGLVVLLIWMSRSAMLTPVPRKRCLKMDLVVHAGKGSQEYLEQTVDGLMWLISNGTLPAEKIIISDIGMDAEDCAIAERLARRSNCIHYELTEEAWAPEKIT